MKSEQHVWEEIYDAITEVESTLESDVINAIRDMEKVDEVIKSSGYAHWYHKRGGGTSGEFQKVIKMVNETSNVINSGMIHRKTLASIDSKFAEKMKQAIENHLNKVNEGDHKYKSTIMHTVDTTIGQYDEYGNYSEYTVQQTIPLSADELMQLNQPELQGLKEKYQKELETYKNKMISDPQTKLSDEQKKQIENMNVTQFLGYTGSIGEYKGALSDSQEAWKTFGLITDIVVGIGSVVAAPFTGGLSLAAGAAYFTGKAAHGLITGKNLYTGETLTNEDKAWLVFDAATSLLAAGAGIKALSSGGKVLNAVAKAATIGDHTLNLVQAGMAGGSGIQMLQKGDIIGGVTLLSLAALGAHGGAKTSKVAGEVEENVAKTATKTSIASERMGQFVDKMSDLKVKGLNAFDNASVKFADAMGLGDNLAFAGGTIGVGKSFSHIDDTVEKTIAKVEGAGGNIGKSLNHVDDEFERTAGKVTEKLKDEIPPLEKYPTYEEAKNTLFKNSEFPPSEKMYNENIDVYNKTKYFSQETGDFIYPPNNGAVKGTNRPVQAEVGQIVDRYGFDPKKGQYFGRMGDSFESRSLPPSNNPKYGGVQYTKYEVLKPFEWEEGEIAQWFGKNTGGGKQWYVDVDEVKVIHKETGELIPATLENLLNNNYLNIL